MNSLRDVVNAFVPSGKIMQIVDQKLVRNISYSQFLNTHPQFRKGSGIYLKALFKELGHVCFYSRQLSKLQRDRTF